MNRRQFIGQAGCAAIGSTSLFSTLANLFMTNVVASERAQSSGDYKALVCFFLSGGNDSFNMLVPRTTSEYNIYQATRSDLALGLNSLLPINPTNTGGKVYGLHPALSGVQNLFDTGKIAFVSNVGTLVEPIANKTEYESGTKTTPLGLYSHSDQTMQWQTSVPQSRDAVGWGGKVADMLHSLNSIPQVSMNISLSGRNTFQTGNTLMEYVMSRNGNTGIKPIRYQSNAGFLNLIRQAAIDDYMSQVYSNAMQQTFAMQAKNALEVQELFSTAISSVPEFSTQFSSHYTSQNMQMIAKVIAARSQLGMCRQTFFVDLGGWDMHSEVLNSQNVLFGYFNAALTEFYSALEELGMADNVTTFTVSEFGRTLTSNGNGSDHAWGGNQLVMGGAVDGTKVFGDYPELSLTNSINVSDRGVLIPGVSTDEYFAELALWFGISPLDLPLIFPNIGEFYNINSSNYPIGFLQ